MNSMFLGGLASFGGSFVFLDVSPSLFSSLIFPLFWVFSFIYHWQGFIPFIYERLHCCYIYFHLLLHVQLL